MKPLDVFKARDRAKRPAVQKLTLILVSVVAWCSLIFGFGLAPLAPSQEPTGPSAVTSAQFNLEAPVDFSSRKPAPLPISASRIGHISRTIRAVEESCLVAGMSDTSTQNRAALSELFKVIALSRLGNRLLQTSRDRRVLVCFDETTDLMAYYRAGIRLIGLKPDLKPGNLVAYLAHELSHVPQHSVYSDNRYFSAADLILLRRMREAAAEALSTRISWQLRRNGYSAAWDLKRRDPFYGDIVEAFNLTIAQGKPPDQELQATKRAFDAWFMRPIRLDVYDHMTITHLNRISGDPLGLMPPRLRLSHGFLAGLTQMEDGQFVSPSARPSLTDPFYSGNISSDNMSRLIDILDATNDAEGVGETSDAAIGGKSSGDSRNSSN